MDHVHVEAIGFKDMHPHQVDALFAFIELALRVADQSGNEQKFQEVFESATDAVLLFGGSGIEIKINPVC